MEVVFFKKDTPKSLPKRKIVISHVRAQNGETKPVVSFTQESRETSSSDFDFGVNSRKEFPRSNSSQLHKSSMINVELNQRKISSSRPKPSGIENNSSYPLNSSDRSIINPKLSETRPKTAQRIEM
jgi:hypothetical protein